VRDRDEGALSCAVGSTSAGIAFALLALLNSAGIGYPGPLGVCLWASFAVSLELRAKPRAQARVGELADLTAVSS